MNIKQKVISLMLALCLVLSIAPMQVFAQEEDMELVSLEWFGEEDYSSEALYEAYAATQFFGGTSLLGSAAGEWLTGNDKIVYDAVVPILRQIANGERASTAIAIGKPTTYKGVYYPVDVELTFGEGKLTKDMISNVMNALLADLPYECYWFEKTTGLASQAIQGSTKITQLILKFSVGDNYQGASDYTVNTAKTGLAKSAADNAHSIVAQYASLADYEKLQAYKDKICELVSYDHAAASGNIFSTDIDPWQLISVFDGNTATNVVCEGYSKAFMYLCDLSSFSKDVSAYTVSGRMDGGGHMWNVVHISGKNYMADVTNSDSGTVGRDGSYFLCGAQGSPAAGYTVSGTRYTYDDSALGIWGTGEDSILMLEAEKYDPNAESSEHVHNYGANHKCSCGAIGGKCGENLTWTLDIAGTLSIEGTGEMYDYVSGDYTGKPMPWGAYWDQIQKVVTDTGVTKITRYAFEGCENLKAAVIGDTVTYIGEYAFGNCISLENILIPGSVREMNYCVFYQCSNLRNVTLSEGVTIIGEHAFNFCTALTEVTIPKSVEKVSIGAFSSCKALEAVVIENGVKVLADYAFANCENLEKVTFRGDAPQFGDNVFSQDCVQLHYPLCNSTWTAGSMEKCEQEAQIAWISYGKHTIIEDAAVEPTCTTTGLSEGAHCSVCNESLIPQTVIEALGHTEAIDEAVAPTCTETGLTEGKHCSVCGEILIAQESIPAKGHSYDNNVDGTCNSCGINRETVETRKVTHMFRMYNPNTGEHFYTGSEEEKSNLVAVGWQCEGVGFTFPANTGAPVYRLFQTSTGEHLYTMGAAEKNRLMAEGWNYEGIAFNSAYDTEAVQHRLHNPNATVGAYHFTFSEEEMQNLISLGWEYQGIGWYSCWK